MEIQKTTGIVLSSRASGEADYLVRFYTRDYGKRDFVFKGIAKSKKRSPSVTEPGTVAEIIYYFHEEKSFHTVNEFQILRQPVRIRDHLSKIFLLYFFLEAVDRTTGFNDANRMIFDLLAAGIETLPETGCCGHLGVFFIIHFLRLHGLLPDFRRCKICRRDDFSLFKIDSADFHPVCGECGAAEKSGVFLTREARDFINEAMSKKFLSMDLGVFPVNDILNLLFQLCLIIQSYFHIELKSKEMLFSELSGNK